MFSKITDFMDRHPEILLLVAATYLWNAYGCLKDYREAVKSIVEEAVEIAKDAS